MPIQGGKGYSMDVHRPTGITIPTILLEAKAAITPMDGFTRFAGTMEFSGNNTLVKKERVEALANAAKKYYKNIEINEEERANATSGLRPVSPDGVPFIGKTSKYNNLTIAAGHAMMGWSLYQLQENLLQN
ncbi:NAD(P)/FAD-dependent oxidoreductase [Thalassobellus suaedae]|uniref:FAD-dependent oxidoreductase n=1 Tax=Thalassobellus suaedae TaxID=3074124 RepID=A0ABY9XV81_9FLAO|nr:FAD-dependent oxidoreductase [Flavobacteriaceae bacterium HL-DH14]